MEVGGQRHAPAASPPRKTPPVHCIGGGWLGLGANLDGYGNLPPGLKPGQSSL
jgi:hypothetical protein